MLQQDKSNQVIVPCLHSGLQIRVRIVNYFLYFSYKTYVVVLKRTVSIRRIFSAPKVHVEIDGYENNYINFTLIKFRYLILCNILTDPLTK